MVHSEHDSMTGTDVHSPRSADGQVETRKPLVAHVTTSHHADDVRILERECRTLGATSRYRVLLVAGGESPEVPGVAHVPIAPVPTDRIARIGRGAVRTLRVTRGLRPDLWHFHDLEALPAALRLAHRGERVIWDAHENYFEQFSGEDNKNWIPAGVRPTAQRATSGLLRALDRTALGVIAATEGIAARYSNPNTVVVGNGARVEDFRACRPDFSHRRALFTGHATSTFLFQEVVDAVASIDGLELWVAGRQPESEALEYAERRLRGRIRYLGWLNRPELAEAMSRCSVGLATYAPLPTFMDPSASPNKLFEFAAAGLPVVATPITRLSQIVDSSAGGAISPGFSAEALAAALRVVTSEPEAWSLMASGIRSWAQNNDEWKLSARRLVDLYDRLLGNG